MIAQGYSLQFIVLGIAMLDWMVNFSKFLFLKSYEFLALYDPIVTFRMAKLMFLVSLLLNPGVSQGR
jgi:hypothetical protein